MATELDEVGRDAPTARTTAQSERNRRLISQALQLVTLLVLAGLVSVWLGQDANWDLQNYHLYNAFAFLNGRYDLDPGATPQWYLNPLLDVPYYLLVQYLGDYPRMVAFIQGSQTGAAWFILWRLIAKLSNDRSYLVARIVVWASACTGTMLISETGTTFNDIAVTVIVLWSMLFLFDYIKSESKASYLALAYFLLGIAVGLKLTAAIYLAAALALSILIVRGPRLLLLVCLASIAGILVSRGWWILYLELHYESPIFPFFNGIVRSDWWPAITVADHRFLPRNVVQWIAYPTFWVTTNQNVVTEVPFADGRLLLGLVAGAAIAGTWLKQTVSGRFALGRWTNRLVGREEALFICSFFIVSYVIWLRTFSIYRYGMPLECLSPVLAFVFVIRIYPSSDVVRNISVAALCCVLLIIMAATRYPNWMRVSYSDKVLNVETSFDYKGATILAMSGSPPVSFLFTQMSGAEHFITIGPGWFKGTRLFAQQSSMIHRSTKIYIITKNGITPELATKLYAHWELRPANIPCVQITSNIGGSFKACKLNHSE